MDKFTEVSQLGLAKQDNDKLRIENDALRECIDNYEVAIKQAQSETKRIGILACGYEKKLKKLIKLVTHNAKNSETILSQLG